VDWEPRGKTFQTSLKAVLGGPKPPAWRTTSTAHPLRVTWIRGPIPRRAMTASTLWHVAVVLILLLPIWKAFGSGPPDAALSDLHITWDMPLPDLRPISPPPAPRPKAARPRETTKPAPTEVAELVHPRQTILSQPLKMTHPRQTLIQPDAPASPPKIAPQLPNMVEWGAAAPAQPRLRISASQLAPILRARRREKAAAPQIENPAASDSALATNVAAPSIPDPLVQSNSAPRLEGRRAQDAAVPEIENRATDAGALNIAPEPPNIPRPRLPMNESSARIAPAHRANSNTGPAPEIGNTASSSVLSPLGESSVSTPPRMPATSGRGPISRRRKFSGDAGAAPNINGSTAGGDTSLRRLVAISSAPAPPSTAVPVPKGNLAAKISMAPDSTQPGASASVAAKAGVGPPGVSITTTKPASSSPAAGTAAASAPVAAAAIAPTPKPAETNSATKPPAPVNPMRRRPTFGPGDFDSGMPPERILGDKRTYTLYVNLPNLTSASGSWVLNFAQLQESRSANFGGSLSAPVPVRKVDPKYPESLMDAHVEGEVVLYSLIRADGTVDSIQVLRSLDPQLDRNAMEALSRWKFSPATLDGVPVDLEAVIHIPFRAPSEF